MPIYDFHCTDCGHTFEELTAFNEDPRCASCGGEHTQRQFSFGGGFNATQEEVNEEPEEAGAESHGEAPRKAQATLRGQDERAWDLERDFERRHANQLAEIAEKSTRVSELMGQIEKLEPLFAANTELTSQLAEERAARQVLEGTERAQAAALEQRATELATADADLQGLQTQLTEERGAARAQQASAEELLAERDHRIEGLCGQVEGLRRDLETRTAALFKRDEMIQAADQTAAELNEELRELDRERSEAHEARAALESELTSTGNELCAHRASESELARTLAAVELQLQGMRDELSSKSGALEATQKEKSDLQLAWSSATGEVERHRAKCLASARHLTATQSVIEELAPMLRSLETTLGSGVPETPGDPDVAQ